MTEKIVFRSVHNQIEHSLANFPTVYRTTLTDKYSPAYNQSKRGGPPTGNYVHEIFQM